MANGCVVETPDAVDKALDCVPRANGAVLLLLVSVLCLAAGAAEREFTIREPFGLEWGPDRVNYTVEFAQGEVAVDGLQPQGRAGPSGGLPTVSG